MDFIKEKIRVMTEKLDQLRTVASIPINYEYTPCPEYKTSNTPPAADAGWITAGDKTLFDGADTHYWLHVKVPKNITAEAGGRDAARPAEDYKENSGEAAAENPELRLSVKTGHEGEWDATNPQFTVFVDGSTEQALDVNHTWYPLEHGREYNIYLYLYTGKQGSNFPVDIKLDVVDLETEALYYDIHVPYLAMLELDENSYDYIKIRDCLDKALLLLDLRDVCSSEFRESVRRVRTFLKENFYNKICGSSEASVSCIGHTHIDVAWLWTVAQTREKAQRSFSTVIQLMKRYPEYIFMSSQPQLYQFVKENDPDLYAKIRKAAAEGRWEPEGAMWLEADTNLIHGESLIRQILYGKRFMKEEFGVESHILWLPDVFGYSGALPQILKKSGVDQFFTAKMSWSESNKLPNDTFLWEGIDGSSVFASIIKTYVCQLDPKTLKDTWDNYKNKSLTNTTLVTFGHGDGGGGPTPEMLENYRRLEYGIPGIPKAKIEKAGKFFEKIEADFIKNTKELRHTPRWVGEMYLEMHRGTYTSQARNKKNNRKSELLYLMLESAAAADMVLNGGEYPTETIRRNTENILLNQFHDIIPGSSIGPVYKVTDQEYDRILSEGQAILDKKLEAIRNNLDTAGGIFVYNPTPFVISDTVTVDGSMYQAENIPAHGWKVIHETPGRSVPGEEPVRKANPEMPAFSAAGTPAGLLVKDHLLENDVIRVEFNDRYHIISVYDKTAFREVIEEGQEGNVLEVYEDYPRDYDAWEITSYYKQKKWIADSVDSVQLLADGILVKRQYGHSEITQKIRIRPGSKRIDFETVIDWHEDHVLLKTVFPVTVRSMYATYDIQFGHLKRPTHENTSWDAAKFEVCAHKWADLSEGNYGVSILNDCKYGYSVSGNIMSLSLLKAATHPDPDADRGVHSFTYSLYPHEGDFREGNTIREAYLLNTPLIAGKIPSGAPSGIPAGTSSGIPAGTSSGMPAETQPGTSAGIPSANVTLPEEYALITCDRENVLVETIKKAEADDSVVVRLYEAYDQKTRVKIRPAFDYSAVYLCDLLENNIRELQASDGSVELNVTNFEIITLKFKRG